jgi:hypothetical protein
MELCILLGCTLMLFVLFLAIAMGTNLILWKLQSIPNNVVLGCIARHTKIIFHD